MAQDNTHPLSGAASKIGTLLKGNPIGAFLAALMLLAVIMPARSRKQKRKNYSTKRRRRNRNSNKGNPGNPGKTRKKKRTKSGKKLPRSVNVPGTKKSKKTKKSKSSGTRTMPERFKNAKKGTALMTEKMNWLRSLK